MLQTHSKIPQVKTRCKIIIEKKHILYVLLKEKKVFLSTAISDSCLSSGKDFIFFII